MNPWLVVAGAVALLTLYLALRGTPPVSPHQTSGVVSTARRMGERRADELIADRLATAAMKRFVNELQEALVDPHPTPTAPTPRAPTGG